MAELDDIVGGWSLTAAKFELSDGSTENMYGPNPQGSIVFTAERRVTAILTSGDRASSDPPERLYQTMVAYTGRFTLEGNRLEIEVDASWAPAWLAGGKQVRFAALDGDVLHIRTASQTHPALFPGRQIVGLLTWRRDDPLAEIGPSLQPRD